MARPKITLYVDIVSPFAYIAYYVTRHSPVFAHCEKTYIPIFLGGVMKMCGNIPPIQIKNKDKWVDVERMRWARYFGVPMIPQAPKGFPPLTLSIMRTVCALSLAYPDKLITAFDALYESFWENGNAAIGKPEGFGPVLETVLGKDRAAEVMKKGTEKEAKDLLIKNSDAAFQDDAFGLPWFVCTNTEGKVEKFWGCDHLGQVVDFLGLDRASSKGAGDAKGWRAVL